MQKDFRVNNRIRVPEVSLIDEKGQQLGVVATVKALAMANEIDLDLVEVGPQSNPPVAKIMDYGKYMYQRAKQEKKTVKQKDQETKTIRIGFKTGEHDLKFKAEKVDQFLKSGHIVRLELFLRGREKALAYMGQEKIDNFAKFITHSFDIHSPSKRSPRGWDMVIKPPKNKQ